MDLRGMDAGAGKIVSHCAAEARPRGCAKLERLGAGAESDWVLADNQENGQSAVPISRNSRGQQPRWVRFQSANSSGDGRRGIGCVGARSSRGFPKLTRRIARSRTADTKGGGASRGGSQSDATASLVERFSTCK